MTDPATFRIDASVDRLKDVRRFDTDGATETRDARRRFYGEDRLLANLGLACGRPAEEIARALIDEVTAFRGEAEPFDDLTLLVLERRPG